MIVELARKGTIKAIGAAASNPGRCGNETLREFTFEVLLRCDATRLDENDFVIDHTKIPTIFNELFGKEQIILSCELIAARALVHLFNQIPQSRRLSRIEVNIIADTVSHRAIWEAEEMPLPAIPLPKAPVSQVAARWTNDRP